MKFKIKQFLVLIALLFSCQLEANSFSTKKGSVKGIIVDKGSNKPVEYANLSLYRQTDSSLITGTVSTVVGEFTLNQLDIGEYYLKIQFIGYQSIYISNIKISLDNRNVDLGSIGISPSVINLEETEIIATNDYINFEIDKTVINVSEQISAEGSAVVDALINVPSVQVDGGGNVTLRGSPSFTLLIDGQPSVLAASDALNQIQSSSVDKIEIITNPSVKYDSDGTSGIINLLMKKQRRMGTSGQVTFGLATGDKYSGSILINQRSHKIRTHFGATYSNKRKRTDSKDYREVYAKDTIDYQSIVSDRDIYRRNYKFNGGIIWDVDTTNSFSFDAEVGQWEFDRNIISNIYLYNNTTPLDTNRIITNDNFKVTNNYVTSDLGYTHMFKGQGHNLVLNLYYSKLINSTPNDIRESSINNNSAINIEQYVSNDSKSNRDHIRFKADYSIPISEKNKIETGYQLDTKLSVTDYTYSTKNSISNNWVIDTILSDNADYYQIINSIYGIYGTSILGMNVNAGLKVEFVNRRLFERNSINEYLHNDINLFPSLHLAKVLTDEMQLSLSYSRRVNRPNEWMLLPAVSSSGRNMLQIGNPELLPDFTNSYELSMSLRNDIWLLNTQLFARQTKNAITSSIAEKNGVFYQSYENIDSELATGVELMTNINIKSWWRVNLSASGYYYNLKGTLNSGYIVDNSSFAWNGSFRATFIVKRKTYLEFLAIYYGPSILPQGKSKDFYYFDFFVRRNFFNRRLTVALRSHNTFDTGIYIEDTKGVNYKAHTWFKYEGPTFMVTLTYRLNNFKRHRSSGEPDMNFDSRLDL